MNTKRTLYLSLTLLIASFATLPKAHAQVPCSPSIIPQATLFVNWPQFQFDAAHTGCNSYESILNPSNVGNLTLDWQYPTMNGLSPVLANGLLYVGDGGGTLSALNASTGAPLWTYQVNQNVCLTEPAVANGIVYFGCSVENDYGHTNGIYALDASTGVLRWSVGFGGTRSFTVANGILYYGSTVGGVIGRLTALNASSGAFLWSYDAGLVVTTPAVANGIAYFGADDRNVYALNASTGAFIWSAQTGGTAYVGPVANGKVYAAYNFGLSAFNASTGALIWVKASFVGASAVARGVLYATATSPNAGLYALNANTGDVLWGPFRLGGVYTAVANGVVYTSDGDKDLYALDANTGAQLWDYTTASQFYAPVPAVVNGKVYIGTTTGPLAFHLPGQ